MPPRTRQGTPGPLVSSSKPAVPPVPSAPSDAEREVGGELAREIADSLPLAGSALAIYRLALARLTPAVGASFAAVFLRDPGEPLLLGIACAHSWPQSSARFLSELRVREGRGPTGRSVRHKRPVEVEGIFDEDGLEEWWEPARELGFVSVTAHPLTAEDQVFGALSVYFRERQRFDDHSRTLVAGVARQLSTAAGRAPIQSRPTRWLTAGRPEKGAESG